MHDLVGKPGALNMNRNQEFQVSSYPSRIDSRISYPEVMTMQASSLEFGTMLTEDKMYSIKRVEASDRAEIFLRQNMKHRELQVEFSLRIRDWRAKNPEIKGTVGKDDRDETFKFTVPFSQLGKIHLGQLSRDEFALYISLENPPKFFRKDSWNRLDERAKVWRDNATWFRQTDVVYARSGPKHSPIMLQKIYPILDLGRWTTYRLIFKTYGNDMQAFSQMKRALSDYNVMIQSHDDFKIHREEIRPVWDLIDRPKHRPATAGSALEELLTAGIPHLSFAVRYQLEVCLSHRYLDEFKTGSDFIDRLTKMDSRHARDLLEFITDRGDKVHDAMSIFDVKATSGSTLTAKVPKYCALVRSANVTPTTIYYNTPFVETSNRVIRQFSEYSDRFLRVRFSDEKLHGRIYSTNEETHSEVFTRIKRTLTNGIRLGDRHYEFLAFGNSQIREHGAYFFARTGDINADRIRNWMGHFVDIKIVAKHASRLGQCFSTTRAIVNARATIVEIQDVVRNGYTFTDGVGKISTFLAQMIAEELGILSDTQDIPSVFQFRLGGCKGVLAVCPDSRPLDIHIRPSQYKFPASHEGLEINRWSRYTNARLNQQLILVLSTLGVRDEVFRQKLTNQLRALDTAMWDSNAALQLLQKYVDHNQTTLTMSKIILDGFKAVNEPFMMSMLYLWRAWSIKFLKEKAHISIDKGALLLGCVDETASLRGHYEQELDQPASSGTRKTLDDLPEVFVQLSRDPENPSIRKPKILLGPLLLTRSPMLHPGDVRVVNGVDAPQLRHLKDCVVFPQTGDRDVANMCSGGDLDGDDFLVIWDEDLYPEEWNHKPMDYSAPKPRKLSRDVTVDDLTTFFVTYMKNDTLSSIAVAHRAWADRLDQGVKEEKCIELAMLHSKAVDYVKTGEAAIMTADLKVTKWPHFMEKTHLPPHKIYISEKILGQLYDLVERADFVPAYSAPFDRRILDAFSHDSTVLDQARHLKREYDASMLRIMAQLEIKTEFEIWSCFVMSHSNVVTDFKLHERISALFGALKDQYRDHCFKTAGVSSECDEMLPFVAAMYTVTAEEVTAAVRAWDDATGNNGDALSAEKGRPPKMPLMSFPWLFQRALGKIAQKDHEIHVEGNGNTQFQSGELKQPMSRQKTYGVVAPQEIQTTAGTVQPGKTFAPFEDPSMRKKATPPPVHPNTLSLATETTFINQEKGSVPKGATTKIQEPKHSRYGASSTATDDFLRKTRSDGTDTDNDYIKEEDSKGNAGDKKIDEDNEYAKEEDAEDVQLDLSSGRGLHNRLEDFNDIFDEPE